MVKPAYPAHVDPKAMTEGVIVQVTIDKQGLPKDLRVTEGAPELAEPVLNAIRQWRWRPYKLNGGPVEIESNVYVKFDPAPD